MIQVENLQFQYRDGDFTLRIPSLSLEAGSAASVTTLLNLVSGVAVPRQGRIQVGDVEVTGLADAARRSFRIRTIGMVFQEFELLEYLSVVDNILLPFRISEALQLNAEVRSRAEELARRVGLGDKIKRNVNHLSQGERQRVGVCRALLTNPPLLLADEPTGNLDPSNKDRVLDILFDFARETGATLLTVTHDHELLDRFDRVIDFKQFQHSGGAA
jgi:putative ABC transport system ATP-binding protein